jgi:CDP-diacylglycerol---glycerol-3-phosphate 3-phosphatidyltransferase
MQPFPVHKPRPMSVTWNLPNVLTILRLPLLFGMVLLVEMDIPLAASLSVLLLLLAMVSDFLDGFLARKLGQESAFGKIADPLLDKVFVCGVLVWMLALDMMPSWHVIGVILLLTREFAVTGLRGATGGGKAFGADWAGKWKTTFQFAALLAILTAYALTMDHPRLAGGWNGVLLSSGLTALWVSVVLAWFSAWRYFRRWA